MAGNGNRSLLFPPMIGSAVQQAVIFGWRLHPVLGKLVDPHAGRDWPLRRHPGWQP